MHPNIDDKTRQKQSMQRDNRNIPKHTTTDNIIKVKNNILKEFQDVLRDTLPKEPMQGPPMKIDLLPNAVPKHIVYNKSVPLHKEKSMCELVDKAIHEGVIAKVEEPTEWLSPAFLVPKQSGGDRIVVDLSHLNKYIRRPTHPFPTGNEIAAGLDPTSKYFCKMDAVQSFYQVRLDDASSYLTTFLIPCGRFRHLRAPMGCSCSSDEWCQRSDTAIKGIPGTKKLVDDILIEANSLDTLQRRMHLVLSNCRRLGITISRKKLEIGTEVNFAGFIISQSGIKPNPSKLDAISNFPKPKDLTALWSFLGMTNQLSNFLPNLASLTLPLRPLLKKDTAFIWLP